MPDQNISPNDVEGFLGSFSIPELTHPTQTPRTSSPLEITKAVLSMPNNKSPGPDSYLVEFW